METIIKNKNKETKMEKQGLKISKSFYIDHCERDLDAPEILHQTKNHFWISTEKNDAWYELYSDADHYSEPSYFRGNHYFGLCMSAKALVKKMDSVYDDNYDVLKNKILNTPSGLKDGDWYWNEEKGEMAIYNYKK